MNEFFDQLGDVFIVTIIILAFFLIAIQIGRMIGMEVRL